VFSGDKPEKIPACEGGKRETTIKREEAKPIFLPGGATGELRE